MCRGPAYRRAALLVASDSLAVSVEVVGIGTRDVGVAAVVGGCCKGVIVGVGLVTVGEARPGSA